MAERHVPYVSPRKIFRSFERQVQLVAVYQPQPEQFEEVMEKVPQKLRVTSKAPIILNNVPLRHYVKPRLVVYGLEQLQLLRVILRTAQVLSLL